MAKAQLEERQESRAAEDRYYAEVAEELITTVKRFRRLWRITAQDELVATALTSEQAKVLADLRYGPLSMSRIAELLGTTRGAATGMVNRLAAKGLVERTSLPNNRRTVMVKLTPAGDSVQSRNYHKVVNRAAVLLRSLSRAELEAIRQGMTALDRLVSKEVPKIT